MVRPGVWITTAIATGLLLVAASATAGEPKYVGVADCGRCHKKDLIGNQLAEWKKSDHAKAMDALKSEKAQKIAKERGLSKPAHEADECVKCHTLSEEELYSGIGLAFYYTHNMLEAAGASTLMAAVKIRDRLKGKRVVLQMSGCNASPDEVSRAVTRPEFSRGYEDAFD